MSKVSIEGKQHDVRKVFSDDFVFSIPLYQRPYAWTTEQAGELLSDIVAFMGDDEPVDELNPYFLGSVVLIKGTAPEAEIVDGQQRLTTLTILLAALRASVPSESAKDLTPFLYEEGNTFTGTPNRYRLKLRERDEQFFREYIQDKGGISKLEVLSTVNLSDSQKNIRNNALLFIEEIAKMQEQKRVRLGQFILTRCFIVVVSTPDLDSAYRIFSVLNDRGLDLSYTDILKAETIGKIAEYQQDSYTAKWENSEDEIGREAFKELFAHIRTIRRKAKAKETVLKEFRQYVNPGNNPTQFIDNMLLPFADAFDTIRTMTYQNVKGAERVNELLQWLNRIDNFDWMPPAILYLSRNRDDSDKTLRFMADLERLAASLMIQRANINKRIERYGQLLNAIESDADLYSPDSRHGSFCAWKYGDSSRDENRKFTLDSTVETASAVPELSPGF